MRLCNERRNIRRDAALRLHAQMAEKFNVALGAAHRGKRQVADGQLQLRSQRQKILQDLLMDGREKVGKKGVVRDPKVHEEVIEKVIDFAATVGLESRELEFSPIKGPEGNIEYLLHLLKRPDAASVEPFAGNVQEIVAQAHGTLDK